MLLALTVAVQAAVWGLADLSARHAANHGMQTARLAGGTAEAAHAETAALLEAINPRGLTDVHIEVERNAATTTVTVTGTVLQVIPVLTIPVRARAHAPTEPA
jgi:hypothetical protein